MQIKARGSRARLLIVGDAAWSNPRNQRLLLFAMNPYSTSDSVKQVQGSHLDSSAQL